MAEFPTSSESSDARIEREATEWFFRRDAGLSPHQRQQFDRWVADERHRAAITEIERTWGRLAEIAEPVPGVGVDQPTARRRFHWWQIGLAAAAAITVMVWSGGLFKPRLAEFAEHAVTGVGGLRHLDLPDGSVITLNTDSVVDVLFKSQERRVRLLRGEAHFSVARNPDQPFVVEANGIAVRAVGTAFNVRVKAAAVEVLVTEGRVRVDDPRRSVSLLSAARPGGSDSDGVPALLSSGQRVTIEVVSPAGPSPGPVTVVPAAEISQSLSWQKRRLVYEDAPLEEIIADFNRYNRHQLVIVDSRLSKQRFGGTFMTGDFVSFVRVLEQTFGVSAERHERETFLKLP